MANEVGLISDGDGLAILGDRQDIEEFLHMENLWDSSHEIDLGLLASLVDAGGDFAESASKIASNSARWVKLTPESAHLREKFGLMQTKTPGISHAMVGEPGSISRWLQVESGGDTLTINPAILAGAAEFLSGAGALMAQVQRQHETAEITELLKAIDEKLDDVLRGQRDSVLAKMDGVAIAIKEAMTIRDFTGRVSETSWSKVQHTSAIIGEIESSALLQLDGIAQTMEAKQRAGEVAKAAGDAQRKVNVWLYVLARCFQLQEEIAVLELDRVFEESPADLDAHRLALRESRTERRELILEKTKRLVQRLDASADTANSQTILHLRSARATVGSVNSVGEAVAQFRKPLGMEDERVPVDVTRWRDALRDPHQLKTAGAEAGQKALYVAAGAATIAVAVKTKWPARSD